MSLLKKEGSLATHHAREPFDPLREMTTEIDRFFEDPFMRRWAMRWPAFRLGPMPQAFDWSPTIEVFEREGRLITRADLPGVKKDDVKVEVTDHGLSISGERRTEKEETKEHVYRTERSYGSFHRVVPLPEGVKLDDVKASFADGVLEVSVPLPTAAAPAVRTVAIDDRPVETPRPTKAA